VINIQWCTGCTRVYRVYKGIEGVQAQAYHPPFVLQTCGSCILMATLVVYKGFCEYDNNYYGFLNDESQIKTLRNMNTVLMFVIMGLVCRFKAPGGTAVLETCSLTYSINIYILTRLATSRTTNYQPAWDFTKINTLNLIGRFKFSIRFKSLCWNLRVSLRTRMSQNQAKSNYKDCSFGNQDSFVKGTRLSVLILAKSQASR